MPSDHFNISQAKHFPSLPSEIGYHAYSYSNYSNNFNGEIGIVFDNLLKKATLKCQIDNGDLFLNNSGENDTNEDEINLPAADSSSGGHHRKYFAE